MQTGNGWTARHAALIAGYGYLVIFVAAIFAEFFVRTVLVIPGDSQTTMNNIGGSQVLFRLGITGYLVAAVADLVVALALYQLLRPVHQSLALLAAWFRMAHAVILGIAVNHLLSALELVDGAEPATDLAQLAMAGELTAFNTGWLVGLVFFGVHCLLLGYLVLRSGFIPRVLGILLILASLGYLVDSLGSFLMQDYRDYESLFLMLVAIPAVIAELSFCLWLLIGSRKWGQANVTVSH